MKIKVEMDSIKSDKECMLDNIDEAIDFIKNYKWKELRAISVVPMNLVEKLMKVERYIQNEM